jgi:hypothetical protein
MKLVKESLNEFIILYHVSQSIITDLLDQPIFFSTSKEIALGFIDNPNWDVDDDRYMYKAKLNAKIASQQEATEILEANNEDFFDYSIELADNPFPGNIPDSGGTTLLQDAGFDGVRFSDYDPRDNQKDIESIVIWNPSTIQEWQIMNI